jgi:hypothetical protein
MIDPATPTPDTTAPTAQEAVNALSPEARASWELTGDWPAPKAVTTTEIADPDDEPDPAAATVTTTAPEPVAQVLSKRQQKEHAKQQEINDAIRSRTEAEQRAATLEARIADLERTAPPAAKTEAPVTDPADPEPQEAAFEDYRAFVKAMSRWEIRQDKRESEAAASTARAAQAEQARTEAFQTQTSTWVHRRDAFAAENPTFAEHAMPFLDQIHAGTPLGDVILDSEVGPQLALYLSEHPDEAERIVRLAPISALRALGKLEAQFDLSTDLSTTETALAGSAAKTVTTAPAPATTLAARSADPADPIASAVARGDFSAFERLENQRLSVSR